MKITLINAEQPVQIPMENQAHYDIYECKTEH